MVHYQDLFCESEKRRSESGIKGIDYIEVSAESLESQKELKVYFLDDKMPSELVNPAQIRKLVHISNGVRIKDIEILGGYQEGSHLVVEVDKTGDSSLYTLTIDSPDLDPAYRQCDFSFKQGCPSRLDCKPRRVCPTEKRTEPLIDYMAKDYASFRQALVDLIPSLVPDWKERHEADLGITLLEQLAYAADHLSYYQDAVANEAYLKTARQRISVRRHARLIDYHMHDGVSARAFIHFDVSSDGRLPAGTLVLTQIDRPLGSSTSPPGHVIPADLKTEALSAADVVFETIKETHLHECLNDIKIHTWGNERCCLPLGTTTADLEGDLSSVLHRGSLLLFEEILGIGTWLPEDADPAHKQVVRLKDEPHLIDDPLSNPPAKITRVTWDWADRLKFPFCISSIGKDGNPVEVGVARGNMVLADHGCRIESEKHPGPEKPVHKSQARAHRIRLKEGPLSFRIEPDDKSPVSQILDADPHLAKPQIVELKVASQNWGPAMPSLMNSGPFDPHFVVETDNEGRAWIRFGDGEYGMPPPNARSDKPDSEISVTYRVGVGRSGNVGSKSLVHIIEPANCKDLPGISSLQNPLPAWGGIDPESMEKVKQISPAAFHAEQLRAVTEEDYARAAEGHTEVSKAVATFRWTGSWHTVFITIDPVGGTELTLELKQRVRDWVARFTQAGYDLEIDEPHFVPVEIEVDVCAAPDRFRGDVEEALLLALGNQQQPDGRMGFFHPDRFTFGQALYLSEIYAAIEAVDGVESAMVRVFQRYGKPSKDLLKSGRISMGRLEIVRMDNDPNFPENGILKLNMLGGK